ncbi:MAG: hypothetical protein NUV72_00625 [Bauldia sp.]|nr:hypothetical protein [Bauldia sp.]
MAARIDRDELRALVRQALKDALGTPAVAASPTSATAAPAEGFAGELRAALVKGRPAKVAVTLQSSADLDRFARNILHAGEHADLRAAIAAGDIHFEVAHGATEPRPATDKPAARGGAFQMRAGVLSETRIIEIARTHNKIVVGNDVVLTPLARDKAREMKVELVRQKP